jgi:type I restriction enzyme, S subunit
VIGRATNLGIPQWCQGDYWPLNTTLYVTDFRGNDPRFVFHLFETLDLSGFNSGSVQPMLNRNYIARVPVRLPPPAEQRRIAGVLGSLDDLIEVNRGLIRDIDTLGSAILARALPATMREVDGREADGWSLVSLDEGCRVIETGKRPKGGVSGIEAGVPSIGAESINGLAFFDFSKLKYVPREFYSTMRRGHLAGGDVLVYKDGGTPGKFLPKVGMVGRGFPFEEMCINEHVFRVQVKEPLSNAYLYFWLKSDRIMDEMRRAGTGAAIPGINRTAFGSLPLAVPPEAVTGSLCNSLASLADAALDLAVEARQVQMVRDELLPLLMGGQIRVGGAAA